LRRLTEGTDERATHAFGVVESATHGNSLDRFRPAFDLLARCFEAVPLDRLF
jgi:hypothetical protein